MTEEPMSTEALRELIPGTIFAGHIHHFDEIDSTNSAAMLAAQSGAAEGSVFLAERQTEGRGRGGKKSDSKPRAGYLSNVLRPPPPANDRLSLCLAAGPCASAGGRR